MSEEGRVHPDCRNAYNPYHVCTDYCFKIIAEVKARIDQTQLEGQKASGESNLGATHQEDCLNDKRPDSGEDSDDDGEHADPVEEVMEEDFQKFTGRKKRLWELRQKMNKARKDNQTDIAQERKRMEAPTESRGISKQKWLEERKKRIGKLLDANGLDMKTAYMLDTEEMAETKYKKWEKDPAPSGWDGEFRYLIIPSYKTLYNAYKKRTKNIEIDLTEYNRMKESDPEFYREASSLQYGKAPKISEDKIEKMVKELKDRDEKRGSFSRRRRFHDEKDIDSINDRNEHFNKKIERAFGKYTLEIKNNLERGTALPD
ncbi:hypothetical protein F8388_025868 [Cannabis sativa]|uniref:Pre-mRNA-splicing factor SYF2 n=1 Tax=Cannabis sativa TaxID=3483 RepID=A0A7J6FCG1_CANSA|nr:hypothetical protein F8388_025868 [Cannabis sativa]